MNTRHNLTLDNIIMAPYRRVATLLIN